MAMFLQRISSLDSTKGQTEKIIWQSRLNNENNIEIPLTSFDIYIEEFTFEQRREGHDNLSITQVDSFLFDFVPDQIVQVFGQDELDLLPNLVSLGLRISCENDSIPNG